MKVTTKGDIYMLYTVTTTLPISHGGRTQALLRRIKLIDEEFNLPTKILTTNYYGNYPSVYKRFLKENKITKNIEFENMYEWLSNFKLYKVPKTFITKNPKYVKTKRKIKGLKYELGKDQSEVHYYNKKSYVRFRKYYGQSNVLQYEDYISPSTGLKYERHEYNLYGLLHRKIFYVNNSSIRHSDELIDSEGTMYCKRYFNNNEKNKINCVELYENGKVIKTFKNDKVLAQYYFQSRFKDNDVVFSDARFLDAPLIKQTHQTKNILVFHSSHLKEGKTKKSYKYALEHSNNVDKYIVLTHQQMQDIQEMYPIENERFELIPHFIELNHRKGENEVIQEDRFIYIGRFSSEKQMDHLIKAYDKFVKSGHQTKLHLFGRDEDNQLPMMRSLIAEYHLEDMVEISKYTKKPLVEFEKSKASILTSKYEGFGLTIMESIEMGCPVLSYDVRYGPNEIINHGENGYLIEENHIEQLAHRMIDIVEHPLRNVRNQEKLTYSAAVKNYHHLLRNLNLI